MSASKQDIWSAWLLERRGGGDREIMQKALHEFLFPLRDKILKGADLKEGETLLDVGCGDGLIGFGALERTKTGHVIMSDISKDLLDHSRALAEKMGVLDRCTFLNAPAQDHSTLADASVDVVTTRSVLIYVSEKGQAFAEFYRVLKPGGRISLFEPINRYFFPLPEGCFGPYDLSAVPELARKVFAMYRRSVPDNDPMLDFDERDLLRFAEEAGFGRIQLDLRITIEPPPQLPWETYYRSSPNPKAPTLEEAVRETLSESEAEAFVAYLRPLVERGHGVQKRAGAFLWASKE